MKLTRLLLLAAAVFLCVGAASADNFVSYGSSTAVNPAPSGAAGAVNSALSFIGFTTAPTYNLCPTGPGCTLASSPTTVNIGTGGGVWAGPIDGSSWVSYENSAPGSSLSPANGEYTFQTTFTGAVGDTLSLNILADDTTSIWLNGVQVLPAAAPTTSGKCTINQPNCTMELPVVITGIVAGSNTLTFGVDQNWNAAMGLDFSGTLTTPSNPTPEPSSLVLLGTGLLGAAGALRRRLRA